MLRCKIRLWEKLSCMEQHVRLPMDSRSGSLLPRVPATGGRTSVRTSFACAFLSSWSTQKKTQLKDLGGVSQLGVGGGGREAGGVGEYSRHSAVG